MKRVALCILLAFLVACGGKLDPRRVFNPERAATEKYLGVKVTDLPDLEAFDETDPNPPTFKADLRLVGEKDGGLDAFLKPRTSVYATAPDGSLWEAY